jgi:hypothetical protein
VSSEMKTPFSHVPKIPKCISVYSAVRSQTILDNVISVNC